MYLIWLTKIRNLYGTIIEGKEPRIKDEQTLLQMEILETGVNMCK